MPTRIKRYEERAELLDTLLARIEAEMGPAAEVERREFVRGRVLGLFGGVRMVEVIATVEIDPSPEELARPPARKQPGSAAAPGAPRQHVDVRAADPVMTEAWPEQQEVAAQAVPDAAPAAPEAPEPAIPVTTENPAASAEIQGLKSSILELQQTMQLLIEQQRQLLTAAPLVPPDAAPQFKSDLTLFHPLAEPGSPPAGAQDDSAPPADGAEALLRASVSAAPRAVNPLAIDPAALLEGMQRGVYERLLDWNIGPYDALELINFAMTDAAAGPPADSAELLSRITREICRNVLLAGGIKLRNAPPGKVVALVGATGVGKTTTIAKLAANFAFQQGKRVSLVSLDNYRIAAAEQLRTYTDIMGIDLDIVFSREEFDQVLSLRRHSDLVLVDTAGRSPLNEKQIYELREIFSAHPPDEVHLVVAAPTKADDLRLILESFLPLSYDYVIVSKLDETRSLGCLYNISQYRPALSGRGVPISYFTVGQSVPEDIRTAELPFIQAWIEQGRIV